MKPSQRIALFATASALVHAAFVGKLPIALPAPDPPTILVTRLAPLEEPPPARLKPLRKPRPARHIARALPSEQRAPPPLVTAEVSPLLLPDAEPAPGDDPVAAAEETPLDVVNAASPQADVAPTAPAPATNDATPLAVRQLPPSGEIRYRVFYGSDQFSIGTALVSWQAAADTYRISSLAETEGLVDLFRPMRYSYVSAGRVTTAGLQPESLVVSRQRRGRHDDFISRFDWATRALTLGPSASVHQVALADGTQDILSFAYQLALLPLAPGRMALTVTNGFKLTDYEVEVGAEEALETPLGVLRTVPLRQVRRLNKEGIELWLALDYHHLPVRVRFLDREGRMSGEQLVTSIRVDPP